VPILTDQERIGTLLGHCYRIDAILGRGGMGVVFKAHREDDRLPVAVKILRPELAQSDPQFAKRFVREARAAAAIRHPNVVEIIDIAEDDDGTIYQVLELLEGETLRDHLERKQGLDIASALELLLPVMHALEAAHLANVVHRDLKPDNIFLSRQPSGEAVPTLLDFGIAKLLDTRGGSFATNTGSIMGTPAYMAPEQASGARDQGPAIDIWAMGIIAYECFAGSPPFSGTSPAHVMLRIMTETPRPLDHVVAGFPVSVARVIEKALARSTHDRHPSMEAFRTALRAAVTAEGIAVPDVGRPSTTRILSIIPTKERVSDGGAPTADPVDPGAAGLATMQRELRAQREERAKADAHTQLAGTPGPSRGQGARAHDSIDVAVEAPQAAARPRWPLVVALVALIAVGVGGIGFALRGSEPATVTATPVVTPPVAPPVAPPIVPSATVVAGAAQGGEVPGDPPDEGTPPEAATAEGTAEPVRGRGPRGRREPPGVAPETSPGETSMATTMQTDDGEGGRRGRGLPAVVEW